MEKRIVIVVGEPSGDRLGAALASTLKEKYPNIEIEGVFGEAMINAGCVQLCSMDTLSVMGFIDPIKSLPSILRLRKWLIRYVLEDPPDLFIGIDAPDFNLNLEKVLREKGVLTAHYVSPSVWAWRKGRIKTIKKGVDLMLTLFPFEEQFYKEHGVPVKCTGHPIADIIPLATNKSAAKQELGFEANEQVVALLPGSRNSEITHMTPALLEAIKICANKHPELSYVMPLVQIGYKDYIEHWRKKIIPDIEIKYVVGNNFKVMAAADFAVVTSGTATLEMMLHKTPMVVVFITSWFNYMIARMLVRVKYISLPNLLADAPIVPELIQKNATGQNIAKHLIDLIVSPSKQAAQKTMFAKIHQELQQGASTIAADAVCELLDGNSRS